VLNYRLFGNVFADKRVEGNGESILVTDCGGQQGCGMSRFPHFLDDRLKDGVEVVGFTRRPPFNPRKIPGTYFNYKPSRPQAHSAAGRIRSIEKSNDVMRS
jgi:hypothetical protein